MPDPAPLRRLPVPRALHPLATLLAALLFASALTEGVGLVLLVPILASLDSGALAGNLQLLGKSAKVLDLGTLLVLFIGLVLLRGAINLARNIIALRLETGIVDALRRRAWNALLHCDWRELSAMRQSKNVSLLIGNIDRAGFGANQVFIGMAALVTLGGLGIAALTIAPAVALAALLSGGLVLLACRGMRRRSADLGERLSQAYDATYASLSGSLGALRAIKGLQREDRSAAEAFAGFADLHRVREAFVRSSGLAQLALQGGGAALLALLVWMAIVQWQIGVAAILPLVALFARALPLLGTVQDAWQNWAHSRPAIDATLALIARAEAAREPAVAGLAPPVLERAITLDQVTVRFAGQDRPALAGVSLTLGAREVLALTGPSGAGKSTLADLLAGLISPDEGHIAIDGQELDPPRRRGWRQRVAYVEQDPVLLAGSIRGNLLWAAPDADEARLNAALEAASATFVHSLPQGLDTPVGDGGRRLSGGERQRLMLARALLREPALLVLDEATSALDSGNETAIAEALKRLRGRMAIVIICHRGALLALADREVRLDQGQLTGIDARGR